MKVRDIMFHKVLRYKRKDYYLFGEYDNKADALKVARWLKKKYRCKYLLVKNEKLFRTVYEVWTNKVIRSY